jgi:hypothetical protein
MGWNRAEANATSIPRLTPKTVIAASTNIRIAAFCAPKHHADSEFAGASCDLEERAF